ncbi:MAG: hypothetical protein R2824_20455 [Saprospiraceae bacterium]|nr:hypothetical protein [Lewinella sp.]
MKQSILIVFALGIMMPLCYSQNNNDLTGPDAKNYQIWKGNALEIHSNAGIVTAVTNKKSVGPQAKNEASRLRRQAFDNQSASIQENAPNLQVTGPDYKHSYIRRQKDAAGRMATDGVSPSLPGSTAKRN